MKIKIVYHIHVLSPLFATFVPQNDREDLLGMANPYFKFKKFCVWHDKCAMKVGTDGVLLGAWVDVDKSQKVLDVGTGTGLVALMIAQRTAAKSAVTITAIDIDSDAVAQAESNCALSPWSEKLSVRQADFNAFSTALRYDTIVSNPPYFDNALLSPNEKRTLARHTDSLSYRSLLCKVSQLLTPDGTFTIIVPYEVENLIKDLAQKYHLFPKRELLVRTKVNGAIKRMLITFSFHLSELERRELVVELARHQYSEEYISLTRDFYLKM